MDSSFSRILILCSFLVAKLVIGPAHQGIFHSHSEKEVAACANSQQFSGTCNCSDLYEKKPEKQEDKDHCPCDPQERGKCLICLAEITLFNIVAEPTESHEWFCIDFEPLAESSFVSSFNQRIVFLRGPPTVKAINS